MGCIGSYPSYPAGLDEGDGDLVAGFIDGVRDWIDLLDMSGVSKQMAAARAIDSMMVDLAKHGLIVFAAVETQMLEGGVATPSNVRVLHLAVGRASDMLQQVAETPTS